MFNIKASEKGIAIGERDHATILFYLYFYRFQIQYKLYFLQLVTICHLYPCVVHHFAHRIEEVNYLHRE